MKTPIHLLYIEDNPGDSRLVREELHSANSRVAIQVECVDRLEAGLAYLTSHCPQAVLLDLNLPDSQGMETLERVLVQTPSLPVIVMTGQADEELGIRAMQAGAQDYLIKGQVDGNLLGRAIQYAIQRKQAERQLSDALEFTEHIVTSSPMGIFTYRLSGECLSVNAAAARMVGATVEQLRSQNFHQIDSWKESGLYAMAMEAISGKKLVVDDVHILTSFGREAWYRAQFVTFKSGEEELLLMMFEDITERKLAEAALRESEENYRQLFEAESDAILLIDNQTGQILQANNAACSLYGYSQGELLDKKNFELSAEPEQTREDTQKTPVIPGQMISIPLRYHRRKDGMVFPVEITGRFFLQRGRPVHITAIRDITGRKQAQAALEASEKRFRTWIENSSDIVTVIDPLGSIQYESDSIKNLLGYAPEDLIGKNAFDFIHPEDRDKTIAFVLEGARNPDPTNAAEFRFLHSDGSWRVLEAVGRPYIDEQGLVMGLINSRDITERKNLEKQLQQNEATLRSFYESAPSLMGITELAGEDDILHVYDNPATCRFFGVEPGVTQGRLGSELGAPSSALQKWICHYRESERTGRPVNFEYLHQDGRHSKWLAVSVAVIQSDDSSPTRFCYVAEDISERKRAEAALAASEKRFRSWIENSSDLISVLDLSGTILYQSPSVQNLLGYAPEELLGRNAFDLMAPEDQPAIRPVFAEKIQNLGLIASAEYRLVHRDGSLRYIESLGRSYIDEHGNIVALIHSRDITERKQAEAAVAAMQRRFQALIENAPDGIALLGKDGKLHQVTPSTQQILGYTLDEAQGTDPATMTHPDDLPMLLGMLNDLIQKPGSIVRAQYRFRHKDGTWRWLESTVSNLLSEPAVESVVFNYRDVSARKQAEEQIVLQANLLGAVGSAAIATDLDGKVIYWNPAAENLYGWSSSEALGRPITDLTPAQYSTAQAQEIMKKLVKGESWSGEFLAQRKDRSVFPAFVSDSPLLDANGNLIGIIGVSSDITQLKHAEAALKMSEQRYRELTENFPNGTVTVYNKDLILVFDAGLELKNSGYTPEDFLGKHFTELAPPETWETARAHLLGAFEGRVSGYEASGLDGQHYSVNVAPLHDANGEINEVLVVSQNITSLKNAQSSLREKERLLSEAQRIGHIGSWSFDLSTDSIKFSDEMYRLLDVLPEEFVHTSQGLLALVYPSDRAAVTRWIQDVRKGIPAKETSFRVFHRNGELRYIECMGAARFDEAGKVKHFIGTMQDVTERKNAEMQIEQHIRQLTALSEIDRAIISSFDQKQTLDVILQQTISQLRVDAADVLLVDQSGEFLSWTAGRGFRTKLPEQVHVPMGESYAGRIARNRHMVRIMDLTESANDPSFGDFVKTEGFISYIGVPLFVKGKVRGVLEVYQRTQIHAYPDWLDFLYTLAGQTAIAIDNAAMFENLQRSNQELSQAYDATIEGWSRAMDLRDRETEGHTQRVTHLTLELASRMGVEEARLVHIRRGALLHDIGKLGVPDDILFKTEGLTPEEWEVMKRHPELAYEMLSPISYLKPALAIPYYHHERWDGSGYPIGLKGEQIPLEARIFAVVDVWDALRSHRPYRKAWEVEKVIDYITGQAGSQFDPRVVECFLKVIL